MMWSSPSSVSGCEQRWHANQKCSHPPKTSGVEALLPTEVTSQVWSACQVLLNQLLCHLKQVRQLQSRLSMRAEWLQKRKHGPRGCHVSAKSMHLRLKTLNAFSVVRCRTSKLRAHL